MKFVYFNAIHYVLLNGIFNSQLLVLVEKKIRLNDTHFEYTYSSIFFLNTIRGSW